MYLHNLGYLYLKQGRFAEGETLLKRSIAIQEKSYNKENIPTEMMTNLAILYMDQGRKKEAESLFKRILTLEKNNLGEEHPGFVATLIFLSKVYLRSKQNVESERFLTFAFNILKKFKAGKLKHSQFLFNRHASIGSLLTKKYDSSENPQLIEEVFIQYKE